MQLFVKKCGWCARLDSRNTFHITLKYPQLEKSVKKIERGKHEPTKKKNHKNNEKKAIRENIRFFPLFTARQVVFGYITFKVA
jgi:hypothetical protein